MLKIKGPLGFCVAAALLLLLAFPVVAAYKTHNDDSDANAFLQVYPAARGTKLDNCYLCHTGGNVGKKYLDSCDYCHAVYGFKPPHPEGSIRQTLNAYGLAYDDAGRNQAALTAIAARDSDGDSYANEQEIEAGRLPGDAKDHPGVTDAPAVLYTREKIRQLPKTAQIMAADTAKAGDFFATYTGVTLAELLKDAGIREDATDVTVFAADGFSKTFPVADLQKTYPQGRFYTKFPWISFPLSTGYGHEAQLPGDLHYLLAYERDGYPLLESKIVAEEDSRSHLDGEGPYRFITPLREPVVPDRSQWTIDRDDPPYPYNPNRPVTRNADFCIKAVVAIQVNTADNKSWSYDWSGRAWEMIEKGELVVYGALKSPKQ